MNKITILVVEEDVACRNALRTMPDNATDVLIAGMAPNGMVGLEKLQHKRADIVLLSSSLPDMTAHAFTLRTHALDPTVGIILLARHDDPTPAIEALEAGAFDFVNKPAGHCTDTNYEAVLRLLLAKVRCFRIEHFSRKAKTVDAAGEHDHKRLSMLPGHAGRLVRERLAERSNAFQAVIIGVSTGGPNALARLLPSFPATFPVPIVITLHMPKAFTGPMAEELDKKSALHVQEAADGVCVRKGVAYLAPGGIHLVVDRNSEEPVLRTIDSPPVNGCKPSVDVLFKSAANTFKKNVIALIMTGMGNDGTKGCAELNKAGAYIIAQDKESSVVWGMPGSVVSRGYANEVLPLQDIADRIMKLAGFEQWK